jgi:alkyl sulfatase BDS1-like metallo-beta-lactamase superfamily hydrolase
MILFKSFAQEGKGMKQQPKESQDLKDPAAVQEKPKGATQWTREINRSVLNDPVLKWEDKADFQRAQRGFIASDAPLIITDTTGNVVFDMEVYRKFNQPGSPAPDTVNPSLWRHAQLNQYAGLFKVTDRIYQVRGYDMALMGIIEGNSGYIIIDTLSTVEESKAARELVYLHMGKKPITAVVITHSHFDHFGGIGGVVGRDELESGLVKIITPEGFTKASLSENVLAAPAMNRRAVYQFAFGLPQNPYGSVDSGLGKFRSGGTRSFLPPTDEIQKTGERMVIDGVELVFVVSPETEAPVEMEFYLPQFKTLCVAENVNMTMHNLYPIRGALTRDAKVWANSINEMLEMFPEAEIAFGTHFWPVWGQKEVRNWLEKQRDMIKYLHDQTLRLANLGYTGGEISQMVKLPKSLASEWFNRDYYGAIQNNVRAIYTRYFGWYDGNAANLNPLPPEETAGRLVEYMGGAGEVLKKARQAFEKGEYRWVAQVLNLIVFDDPENMEARNLEADALEQLGYQQESATFRNAYLVGAQELRTGINVGFFSRSLSMYLGMPEEDLFEALAVTLNGPKAEDKKMSIHFIFVDSQHRYLLKLENSVMHSFKGKSDSPDLTITVDKPSFIKLIFLKIPVEKIRKSGQIEVDGPMALLDEFLGLLDEFNGRFNVMLP